MNAAWGKTEHQARLDDLDAFHRGHISLDEVKQRAKARSSQAGLSQAQTDRALRQARIERS